MIKSRLVLVLVLVTITALIGTNVYLLAFRKTPRIAYVRSYDLIDRYAGTVDARSGFEKKRTAMVANVDSLKMHIENAAMDYRSNASRMTAIQRTDKEKELDLLQRQFYQYSEAIDGRIREEDNKMMEAVLNQVNSFVEEFSKENGYDIVMGTTLSGSLLYGEKELDITEEVLEHLNSKYKGQ